MIGKQNTVGVKIYNEVIPKVKVLPLNLSSYALALSSSFLNLGK